MLFKSPPRTMGWFHPLGLDSFVSGWARTVLGHLHSVFRSALCGPHANAIRGHPQLPHPLPSSPCHFPPLSPHPCLSLRPPPICEPPEPEAGESRDTGVRRGLLEGEAGWSPGYSAGVGQRKEGAGSFTGARVWVDGEDPAEDGGLGKWQALLRRRG